MSKPTGGIEDYLSDEDFDAQKGDYRSEATVPKKGGLYSNHPPAAAPNTLGRRDASAFSTHNRLMENFLRFGGERKLKKMEEARKKAIRTDHDVLIENYKLERSSSESEDEATYEQRLSRNYYKKLYREYGVIDLSKYKTGKFGIRWRKKEEVLKGKGESICGEKKCLEFETLKTFEVPFRYKEQGETKVTMLKLRLCVDCGRKLNYKKLKETEVEIKKLKKREKKLLKKINASKKRKNQGSDEKVMKKRKVEGTEESEEEHSQKSEKSKTSNEENSRQQARKRKHRKKKKRKKERRKLESRLDSHDSDSDSDRGVIT